MMITFLTWRWGKLYGQEYVDRLYAGVKRYYRKPFNWRVIEPEPEDLYLTQIPGCLCRLRMFDPMWQKHQGFNRGDRIVQLDLDSVITERIDILFDRDDTFAILWGGNSMNPCPFNGSLVMFRVGFHHDLWTDFSLEAVQKIKYYTFPDDQAWYYHKIPKAAGWFVGRLSGIYAFQKPGWPKGSDLPSDARMVVFPGYRDPSQYVHLPWIREKWLAASGHQQQSHGG